MSIDSELAEDALRAVVQLPVSPQPWQRLCNFMDNLEPPQKSVLIDKIAALSFSDSKANWLRFSALSCLAHNPDYLVRQASFAAEDMPADAIMTFIGLVWHCAITQRASHQDFVRLFNAVNAVRLQRTLAQQLHPINPAYRGTRARLRIALYTPELRNPRHGGTAFTLNLMSLLVDMGMECEGFAAQEVAIPPEYAYQGGNQYLAPPMLEVDTLQLKTAGSVQFRLANAELSLHARYLQMQADITAYNPDLLVFVGFLSPLVYALAPHYPTLGLSVHALPPLVPVDVWLSADIKADSAVWDALPAPQRLHYPYRFWPVGPAVPVTRETLQIPDDAVVLVTAGYRLLLEMPDSWLQNMRAFLDAHSQVYWLLVGMTHEQQASWPVHPRIQCVEPQHQLQSWLAASDIYVNPPRIGGGSSIAMAMEQGLPVLTLAGSDGADKVGVLAAGSMAAWFDQLAVWVSDHPVRREAGARLKDSFHQRLDISSTSARDHLRHACGAAMASFNTRNRNT
jgi:hypothetical protein